MDGYSEQDQEPSLGVNSFRAYPDGAEYRASYDGRQLIVRQTGTDKSSQWRLQRQAGRLTLAWSGPAAPEPETSDLLAALETAFAYHPDQHRVTLKAPLPQTEELLRLGIVCGDEKNQLTAYAELFWQQPRVWLTPPGSYVFPSGYVLSHGQRHPRRPPKPSGTVYRRHIPWLSRTLSFRTVDTERDLTRFSRWMNDPRVAWFWQAEGDLAQHRAHLDSLAEDPHILGLIGCFDDEPFGYWEVYWAKEDRIAPFYDADDFDRGWHVLIGEARFRGKPFVTAWLPSISHYLFLDDCRTRRLVIEPRSDNHKMLRNLALGGYANLKEFDFPHKRAVLGVLLRERFFAERLWVPRRTPDVYPMESLS